MRKLFTILYVLFFSHLYFAQGVIIISQYYEGSSFNKWLEITNVGDATLNLESPQHYLALFSNANADNPATSSPNSTYTFSGTIDPGEVILVQNSQAVLPAYASGISSGVTNFNGDDLVIITVSNSSTEGEAWAARIDVIGNGTTWGENTSFARKTSNNNPNTIYTIADWDTYTNAQVDGATLGSNERLGEFSGYTPLPVELTSFTASVIKNSVKLAWNTATEINNYGFEVQRSAEIELWSNVGFINGNGTTNSPKDYYFVDDKLSNAGSYYYRLKQVDNDGSYEFSKTIEVVLGSPTTYTLDQNYPNPFNPSTLISFTLPEAGFTNLVIYNSLGQEITELVNNQLEAGSHQYNFDAKNLTSGIYFYKLESENFVQVRKMMLLK